MASDAERIRELEAALAKERAEHARLCHRIALLMKCLKDAAGRVEVCGG